MEESITSGKRNPVSSEKSQNTRGGPHCVLSVHSSVRLPAPSLHHEVDRNLTRSCFSLSPSLCSLTADFGFQSGSGFSCSICLEVLWAHLCTLVQTPPPTRPDLPSPVHDLDIQLLRSSNRLVSRFSRPTLSTSTRPISDSLSSLHPAFPPPRLIRTLPARRTVPFAP